MAFLESFRIFCIEKNGLISFSDLVDYGLNQRQIKKLENSGTIDKISRGIYYYKDFIPDTLKVFQMENKKMIYSNETAAYLHGLTDRFPREYTVSTISGYHLRETDSLKVYYVKKEVFDLGSIELLSPSGNLVQVYNRERTLCDIIKNKERIEVQVYAQVVQSYFKDKVNLNRLSRYAKELGVSKKVSEIVSIMMRP